jgi:hypothetical protein
MKPKAFQLLPPSGIVKRAAQVPQPFALFLYLDQIPYCEIAERDKKDFELALARWRKVNLPALTRSDVRYFIRNLDFVLTEVRP